MAAASDAEANNIKEKIMTVMDEGMFLCKWLYFNHMIHDPDGDFETIKRSVLRSFASAFNKIHDKYQDHVEGLRSDLRRD